MLPSVISKSEDSKKVTRYFFENLAAKMVMHQFRINLPNAYQELRDVAPLEQIKEGRAIRMVVVPFGSISVVPIVRSTNKYTLPAVTWCSVHRRLESLIKTQSNIDPDVPLFNNAMVEEYTDKYRTMGMHTDQALDLAPNSWIAIFSCYKDPPKPHELRRLEVRNKRTGAVSSFTMWDNSVLMFSTSFNAAHTHRIVLPSVPDFSSSDNAWLGVTLRQSKTHVQYTYGKWPQFANGRSLILASEEDEKNMYAWRRQENTQEDFEYPPNVDFTVVLGDMYPPILTAQLPHHSIGAR